MIDRLPTLIMSARRSGDLFSSASSGTLQPTDHVAGTIHLGAPGVSEAEAREVLNQVFAEAGMVMENDYAFAAERTMLSLDGFDPRTRVGYQYVSHGDADVVTDFDSAAESAVRELDSAGRLHLFIVHDGDVRDLGELRAMARDFITGLAGLGVTLPG
jgi:hypothetical protein